MQQAGEFLHWRPGEEAWHTNRRWLNWVILRHSYKLTGAPLTVKASPAAAPWHSLWSQKCLEVYQVLVRAGNLKRVDWNPLHDQTLLKSSPPLNDITFDDGCVAPWEAKLPGEAVTEKGREKYRQKDWERNSVTGAGVWWRAGITLTPPQLNKAGRKTYRSVGSVCLLTGHPEATSQWGSSPLTATHSRSPLWKHTHTHG